MSQTRHRPIGVELTVVTLFKYGQPDCRDMAVMPSRWIGRSPAPKRSRWRRTSQIRQSKRREAQPREVGRCSGSGIGTYPTLSQLQPPQQNSGAEGAGEALVTAIGRFHGFHRLNLAGFIIILSLHAASCICGPE